VFGLMNEVKIGTGTRRGTREFMNSVGGLGVWVI